MFILTTYNICFNSPGSYFGYIDWGCSSIFVYDFSFGLCASFLWLLFLGLRLKGGAGEERGLRCSSKGTVKENNWKKLKEEGSGWGEIGL